MTILHQVLKEVIKVVRNATQQLSLAYQNAQPLFGEHQAYFTPYKNAFEVIGLAEELENDYFQYAGIPIEESIHDDITPLQAAAVFSKLFNQESFFMLHEYSLLAFSQLTETSQIVSIAYAGNKTTLITQLGSVNWVTRFQLLADRLAEVIVNEIKEPERNELMEIQGFIKTFAATTMQYLDSLKAFQTHVVAGEIVGDHQRPINQCLLDLNAKHTELNICRRKFETIVSNLNGFWAEFYKLDVNLPLEIELLTKRISLLEQEEIPLLAQQLQQAHKDILNDLQKYRSELNGLRKIIENLHIKICQKTKTSTLPSNSSTLAWKRAILTDNAIYLKKLFEYGVNPEVVSNYLFQNNKEATIQQRQVSSAIMECIIAAGHVLFQKQPALMVPSLSASSSRKKEFGLAFVPQAQATSSVNPGASTAVATSASTLPTALPPQAEIVSYKSSTLKACGNAKLVSSQKSFFAQLPLVQPPASPKKTAASALSSEATTFNLKP